MSGTSPLQRLQVFSALRSLNFRLLWIHSVAAHIGLNSRLIAQQWVTLLLTNSPFYLGLVRSAMFLPSFLTAPIGGAVADRFPRRNILVASLSCNVLVLLTLATLTATGIIEVWHLVALALVSGLLMSAYMPTRQALIPSLVEREDLMNALAVASLGPLLGRVIGPYLAGVLLESLSAAGTFVFGAASYTVAIALLLLMRRLVGVTAEQRHTLRQNLAEGLRYLRHHRLIAALLLMVAVPGFLGPVYEALLPIFAESILHAGAAGYGTLGAASGVGAALGSLFLVSLGRFQHKGGLLFLVTFLFGATLVLFALSQDYLWSLLLLVGVGGTWNISTTLANTLIQANIPPEFQGRVMGVYVAAFLGSTSLGSIPMGAIASVIGAPKALVLGGTTITLFAMLMLFLLPSLRRMR